MITKHYLLKQIFFLLTGLLIVTGVHGQHLPDKQIVSIRAPSVVKIDGKADEWPEHFQAYNHATDIYYTIANDNSYLYLIVEATEQDVINKIISGGITFSIHKYGEKMDKNGIISVTYPVIEGDPPIFNLAGRNWQDSSASGVKTLINTYNDHLEQKCKWIGIKGVPGMDDVLSVYNTDSIIAAGRLNTKRAYICEFALSIKYLQTIGSEPFKFSYHIVLNGSKREQVLATAVKGGQLPPMFAKIQARAAINSMETDFWAYYTMAEK